MPITGYMQRSRPHGTSRPTKRIRPTLVRRRRSKWSRLRTGLSRFAYSRRKLVAQKRMSRMINSIAETKLIPVTRKNTESPAEIQTNSKAFYKAFVMGTKPQAWDAIYDSLGGVTITKGVDSNQRDGNYVFMQKTHLSVNIDTSYQSSGYRPPMEYRVICGKTKRGNSPSGYTMDPSVSLFLNEGGTHFGHKSSNVDGTDLMMQPLNKRDFYIKSDKKFTLSIPVGTGTDPGGYSGKYPVKKNLVYDLGYYKKTRFEDAGTLANVPYDLDVSWFIIIYARSVDKQQSANDWEVNVRGTTSFKDV